MKHISNKLSKRLDKSPFTDKELHEREVRSVELDKQRRNEIVIGSIVCFRRPNVSPLQIVGKVVAITEFDYIIETSPIKGLCRHSIAKGQVKGYEYKS